LDPNNGTYRNGVQDAVTSLQEPYIRLRDIGSATTSETNLESNCWTFATAGTPGSLSELCRFRQNAHWEYRLVGMSEHIPIERAWILIQEASSLSPKEAEHLAKCRDCGEFLQGFLSVARYIGLSVAFPTRRTVDRDDAA
jgi:hypothetical protein